MATKDKLAIALAGLAPLAVLAVLCWYMSANTLIGLETASARSAVAEAEKYIDRVVERLKRLKQLRGRSCVPDTVGLLDRAVTDMRIVHDIALYDREMMLRCSSRGPRSGSIRDVEQLRSFPTGADIFVASEPLATQPSLIVDLAWVDGGGLAASIDLGILGELLGPFPLADEGALVVQLSDGALLFRDGLDESQIPPDAHRVTALSVRFGFSAEVRLAPRSHSRLFFHELPWFELVGGLLSVLLGWLVWRATRYRHGKAEQEAAIFRALVESSGQGIALCATEGRIDYLNPTMMRFLDYDSSTSLLGQSIARLHPEEERARIELEILPLVLAEGSWAGELSMADSAGGLKPVLASFSLVRGAGGKIIGIAYIVTDIADRKVAEERIRVAKEVAEDATRMKSDFLANMSHEIRTPMNAIIGLAHLVLKTELTARQRDHVEKIQRSGNHLLGIINDILDFSKVEAGQLSLENVAFRMDEVFSHVTDLIAEKACRKGVGFAFDISPEMPTEFSGDPLRLGQILVNLCSNAVKFTEQGGITVSLRPIADDGGSVLLKFSVSDTGIGLTSGQIDHLFQAFRQADASTTRKYGGTGLGLAISKRLAELMGGEIGVTSASGCGSTFWFTVRLGKVWGGAAGDKPVEESLQRAHVAVRLAGARILLVEDNEINREVAQGLLEDVGIAFDIAADGRQAIERIFAHDYDAVLMDMQMPVMDGLAATRLVRADPRFADLPVIAMTANAMSVDRVACLEAGMNDHVPKPISPPDLYRALLKWVNRRGDAPAGISAATGGQGEAMPELRLVDVASGMMRTGNNLRRYLNLLRRFAATQEETPAAIAAALGKGDVASAERLIHTLKGLAGTLGAQGVADAASAAEAAIKSGGGREEAARLQDVLTPVVVELRSRLPADRPLAAAGAGPAETVAALRRLHALLAVDDGMAPDLMLEIRDRLGDPLTPEEIGRLARDVGDYEYSAALSFLEEIFSRRSLENAPEE